MKGTWITDPIFWTLALPALALSGLLIQMILSLFSCCAAFTFRGKSFQLKWWMIPATATGCGLLWTLAVLYILLG